MTTIKKRAAIIAKAAMMKKIVAFVAAAEEPPTTVKIAYIFDMSKTGTGTYLRELESAGKIHRKPTAVGAPRPSRTLPILWMPGQGEGYIPEGGRLDPLITLRQRSVRSYPLHHVRDPFVAAIFGAAVHS